MKLVTSKDCLAKKVVVRLDLNVPMQDGAILDLTRIHKVLPLLNLLIQSGCKIRILSHFGRPEPGQYNKDYSLEKVAREISKLVSKELKQIEYNVFPDKISDFEILENVRFNIGETSNSSELAVKYLADAELVINDAFSSSHRKHCSINAIFTKGLKAFIGPLFYEEYNELNKVLTSVNRPLCVIVGGAKISTKLHLLKNLLKVADHIIVGGGIANTLLLASGKSVGNSLVESSQLEAAKAILQSDVDHKIILPVDAIIRDGSNKAIELLAESDQILDLGHKSIARCENIIINSSTILWNGPVGVYEDPKFRGGTNSIARAVARSDGYSVVGGGDSTAVLKLLNINTGINYISGSGGAFLEFLEKNTLPFIELSQSN